MNPVWVIIGAKTRIAGHEIASVRRQSKLKVGVVSVFAIGLWIGAFLFFYFGFRWLISFGQNSSQDTMNIGDILMARMLGILGIAVFFMLIFSNILVSFSTMYRSREVAYLLHTPVSFRELFLARFWECVMFSSWAVAFLGSPLILAYGITTQAAWPFYLAGVAFYLPFIIIPASLGALITLVLARVFPQQPVRVMVGLAAIAVGLLFLYIKDILNATRLSQDAVLAAIMDATTQTQSSLLPSYWASRGILAAAGADYRECLFQFLLLLSNGLMLTWLVSEAAERIYYRGYSYLAGQDRMRIKPQGKGVLGHLDRWLSWLPNPSRSLVIKDIKLFWRDPAQWSQFVIFFGILAVYMANLYGVGNSSNTSDMWRSWIACLNIGSCTLVLATLTSRFVFPLISLEGHRFWILGLAPLTLRHLVWQKFWLSVCITSTFTVGLAMLSGHMLRIPAIHFWLSVYSVVIANFGLSGLAVGLGSLYPNFQEDNPARIVSGMGGTLNFLLSIGYLAIIVGAQTFIMQWQALQRYTSPEAFGYALGIVLIGITLLSFLTALLPMYLGLRNLERMEF